ncbi:Rossmann fold nucleotide-binding protein [Microbacterium sp. Root53]|uniref:LOG family protein n=1 Tax=Microbacterium sp. Root53 TaxID=1736553 RepID=UPI0006FAA499|nr:LOG family protein [Microbacterium sp. Root53]KQY98735.1 Rossmann fold nucleotide-binding protein [Microbacterium sp. Root53]
MKHRAGRIVTVESLAELDRRLAEGARHLTGWRLIGLDLRDRSRELADRDTSRTTFAGCTFAPGDELLHAARGALILPDVSAAPADPHRATLYTADELYDTPDYRGSLDGRAYAWSQGHDAPDALLGRVLHDDGIDRALAGWVAGRRLVGVMGGHAMRRGERDYAGAARLGRLLGRAGFTVATGGGPGAMEAANLGARLSAADEMVLDEALVTLATAPSYHPSVDAWLAAARVVLTQAADVPATDTLGVPTWHYGHEPPNLFATAIAKYFRNAQREAILLQVCASGIVFLPGAGGTVQEIFQDACENYYASEDAIAPMVLVGREHWTETLPAWALLRALAKGRPMEPHVHLVETVDEAAEIVTRGA